MLFAVVEICHNALISQKLIQTKWPPHFLLSSYFFSLCDLASSGGGGGGAVASSNDSKHAWPSLLILVPVLGGRLRA
jgi:hypothetical protein